VVGPEDSRRDPRRPLTECAARLDSRVVVCENDYGSGAVGALGPTNQPRKEITMTTTDTDPFASSLVWGFDGSGLPLRTNVTIRLIVDGRATISFDNEAPRSADALRDEVDNGDSTWTLNVSDLAWRGSFVAPASYNWLD
jgi:hypothetical protein